MGRARWKIENENNNTLKTKGYHLEHNFGHGKEHLSSLLAAMNILAFLDHSLLSFTDEHYRLIRAALPSRKTFFDDLRALNRYRPLHNWDALMDFMMRGPQLVPTPSRRRLKNHVPRWGVDRSRVAPSKALARRPSPRHAAAPASPSGAPSAIS